MPAVERIVRDPRSIDPRFRRQLLVLVLVVFGVSSLLSGGHSYAIDNEVQFQTTRSLVNLRPYLTETDDVWVARDDGPYRVRDDGTVTAIVPIGQSLLSVPFYVGSRAVAQLLPSNQRDQFVRTGTFLTNSLMLALTAAVVALLALRFAATRRHALLLGYIYALGTYALPNAKTYFTEIGTSFFLAAACLLVAKAWERGSPRFAAYAGLAIGAGFMVRPSAGLFLPVIGLVLAGVVWRRHGWRSTLRVGAAYGFAAIAMLIVNALFNWWRFGSPFDLGYQQVFQNFPLVTGLADQTWSPGKGLVFYAPIVLLSVVGAAMALRRHAGLVALLTGTALANFVFYGRVPFWAGDASWGPRYTLIVLPVLVPLAAPALAHRWGLIAARVLGVVGFLVPALIGSLVNFNTLYINANRELGDGFGTEAMHRTLAWQPFRRQFDLLGDAIGDVVDDAGQTDVYDRGPFTRDSNFDYSFYGLEPRLDVWWLWSGPTGANGLTWLFLVPSAVSLGAAGYLEYDRRRLRPSSGRTGTGPDGTDAGSAADAADLPGGGDVTDVTSDGQWDNAARYQSNAAVSSAGSSENVSVTVVEE